MIAEAIASGLIVLGAFFVLLGSIALMRLPDIFTRLHGPTKATTLGVGAIVIAASVAAYSLSGEVNLKALTVLLFLFITAPVSAHLLGKAAQKELGKRGSTGSQPQHKA
ncbi:MAG: monovalent cation/H(+) antiporter subunit G [Hyphomicrobium sp.]|nr:monovalent cation/H(+) antiporter subunit G [Hyphomicrobium sp.]